MSDDKTFDELLTEITHPKKRAFLDQYPKFRVTAQTASALDLSDRTIRLWKEKDTLFNTAFTSLKKEIEQELILIHEKNIDDVALNTNTPAQSRIFGSLVKLRALAPERYREQPGGIVVKMPSEITVKLGVPGYRDEPIPIETKKQLPEGDNNLT